MSSAEPPSRIPPKQQQHETKTGREELSSKGKVEKVREVDPEEARKKKQFLKYYKGTDEENSSPEESNHPTPFELYSKKEGLGEEKEGVQEGSSSASSSSSYVKENGDSNLPQSQNFWEKTPLPDEPTSSSKMQEDTHPLKKGAHKDKVKEIEAKEEAFILTQEKGKRKKEEHTYLEGKKEHKKEAEVSSMPTPSIPEKVAFEKSKEEKKIKASSQNIDHEKETQVSAPSSFQRRTSLEKKPKEETTKEEASSQAVSAPPPQEKQESFQDQKDKNKQTTQIEFPSLPQLPAQVGQIAMQATQQLAPYLTPSISPLFFQMVGTIHIMEQTKGVFQTEILLNNPAYAHSKFYGATIIIEKYATAPGSFNIRLQGSQQAVSLFKENIPSLMNAFQNGNFSFRINRIEAEYTVERPVFRRKEKGEGRSDSGDSDLGGREKDR